MWPEDAYLLQLGRATYVFAYLEWAVIYLAQELSSERQVGASTGLTAGEVARLMRGAIVETGRSVEVRSEAEAIAMRYERLTSRRNDIIHAHPATIDGDQRLHRKRRSGTQVTVQIEHMDTFVDDCLLLSRDVNRLFWDLRDGRRT